MRSLNLCARRVMTAVALVTLSVPTTRAAELINVEIKADAMCCVGCAKKVAGQLYAAPGVTDVKADVPSRLVKITARSSQKLTLERLWNAVAKAKGGPSELTTGDLAYTFVAAESLPEAERLQGNVYRAVITDLTAHQAADRVAHSVRQLRGVDQISLDSTPDALLITPDAGATLSPWALIGAIERAKEQPLSIEGPLGRMSIEAITTASDVSTRPQVQGTVR
jgi:copper chaperone CopZ